MHAHAHASSCCVADAAGRHLGFALLLSLLTASAEAYGAHHSGSLALLADAGHVAFDGLAIGLAWVAVRIGRRPPTARMPYGYGRVEVLVACANALLLLVVCAALAREGLERLAAPQPVAWQSMVGTAALGLVGNATSLWLLEKSRAHVSVRAAWLHVAGDTLLAFAVLVGGLTMHWTNVVHIDGWLTLAIAAVLAVGAVRLLASLSAVLLQAAPESVGGHPVAEVRAAVAAVAGVARVEALQLWSLTPSCHVMGCHVVRTGAAVDAPALAEAIGAICRTRFALQQVTVQVVDRPPAPTPSA